MRNLVLAFALTIATNLSFSQNKYNIGDTVPEFKLWLTDNSRITKNDIQNKVVVFKF